MFVWEGWKDFRKGERERFPEGEEAGMCATTVATMEGFTPSSGAQQIYIFTTFSPIQTKIPKCKSMAVAYIAEYLKSNYLKVNISLDKSEFLSRSLDLDGIYWVWWLSHWLDFIYSFLWSYTYMFVAYSVPIYLFTKIKPFHYLTSYHIFCDNLLQHVNCCCSFTLLRDE